MCLLLLHFHCFNTQPPEGGCKPLFIYQTIRLMFQHTAARRRLLSNTRCGNTAPLQPPEGGCEIDLLIFSQLVKLHLCSRPKAAALRALALKCVFVAAPLQPPEGGCESGRSRQQLDIVLHLCSRPKAAACTNK